MGEFGFTLLRPICSATRLVVKPNGIPKAVAMSAFDLSPIGSFGLIPVGAGAGAGSVDGVRPKERATVSAVATWPIRPKSA